MHKKIYINSHRGLSLNTIFSRDWSESLDESMTKIGSGVWASDGREVALSAYKSVKISYTKAFDFGNGNILFYGQKVIECVEAYDDHTLYVAFTCIMTSEENVCVFLYHIKLEDSLEKRYYNPEINIFLEVKPIMICETGRNHHLLFKECGRYLVWQNEIPGRVFMYNVRCRTIIYDYLTNYQNILEQLIAKKNSTIHYEYVPCSDGQRLCVIVAEPFCDESIIKGAVTICLGGPYSEIPDLCSGDYISDFFRNNGYYVIIPLRRGTRGISYRWEHSIDGRYGAVELDDIVKGTTTILSRYPMIDPSHIFLYGGSYGGYSAYLIAEKYKNIFRSVIVFCGMYDLESYPFECGADPKDVMVSYSGFADYESYSNLVKAINPRRIIQNLKIPLLIIHTLQDTSVWFGQAVRAYNDSIMNGLNVKLVLANGHHSYDNDARSAIHTIMLEFLDQSLVRNSDLLISDINDHL